MPSFPNSVVTTLAGKSPTGVNDFPEAERMHEAERIQKIERSKVEWEAKQAQAKLGMSQSEYDMWLAGNNSNTIQRWLGLAGNDAHNTGGVLETIGDLFSLGVYGVASTSKGMSDYAAYGDGFGVRTNSFSLGISPTAMVDAWHNKTEFNKLWESYGLDDIFGWKSSLLMDIVMDPMLYGTLGVSVGAKLGAKAGLVIGAKTLTEDSILTLSKLGKEILPYAVADIAPAFDKAIGLENASRYYLGGQRLHMLDSKLAAEWQNKLVETMVKNYPKYRQAHLTASRAITPLEVSKPVLGGLFEATADAPLALKAAGAALSGTGKALRTSVRAATNVARTIAPALPFTDAAREGAGQILKNTRAGKALLYEAADMFHETASAVNKERGVNNALGLAKAVGLTDIMTNTKRLPGIGPSIDNFVGSVYDVFDRGWDAPPELLELKRVMRATVRDSVATAENEHINQLGHLTMDERRQLSFAVEARQMREATGGETIPAGFLPLADHMEKAVDYMVTRMDEILQAERDFGLPVGKIENYLPHLYPNPATRRIVELQVKQAAENVSTSNRFIQQRILATLWDAENLLGEGVVETDALKILNLRSRGSIEMMERQKFLQEIRTRYGVASELVEAVKAAAPNDIMVKGFMRRVTQASHYVLPYSQMWRKGKGQLTKLGFVQGDLERNVDIIRFLQRPLNNAPGGRFEGSAAMAGAGPKESMRLGLSDEATMFSVERDGAIHPLPTVINFKPAGKQVRTVDGKKITGDYKTSQLQVVDVVKALHDPNHPMWDGIFNNTTGGLEQTNRNVKGMIDAVDAFFKKHFDSAIEAFVPSARDTIIQAASSRGVATEAFQSNLIKMFTELAAPLEVRRLEPVLPQELVDIARRTRERIGDISDSASLSPWQREEIKSSASAIGATHGQLKELSRLLFNKDFPSSMREGDLLLDTIKVKEVIQQDGHVEVTFKWPTNARDRYLPDSVNPTGDIPMNEGELAANSPAGVVANEEYRQAMRGGEPRSNYVIKRGGLPQPKMSIRDVPDDLSTLPRKRRAFSSAKVNNVSDPTFVFQPQAILNLATDVASGKHTAVEMTAGEFLKLAKFEVVNPLKLQRTQELARNGVKYSDVPMLRIENGKVIAQDGRHRMRALPHDQKVLVKLEGISSPEQLKNIVGEVQANGKRQNMNLVQRVQDMQSGRRMASVNWKYGLDPKDYPEYQNTQYDYDSDAKQELFKSIKEYYNIDDSSSNWTTGMIKWDGNPDTFDAAAENSLRHMDTIFDAVKENERSGRDFHREEILNKIKQYMLLTDDAGQDTRSGRVATVIALDSLGMDVSRSSAYFDRLALQYGRKKAESLLLEAESITAPLQLIYSHNPITGHSGPKLSAAELDSADPSAFAALVQQHMKTILADAIPTPKWGNAGYKNAHLQLEVYLGAPEKIARMIGNPQARAGIMFNGTVAKILISPPKNEKEVGVALWNLWHEYTHFVAENTPDLSKDFYKNIRAILADPKFDAPAGLLESGWKADDALKEVDGLLESNKGVKGAIPIPDSVHEMIAYMGSHVMADRYARKGEGIAFREGGETFGKSTKYDGEGFPIRAAGYEHAMEPGEMYLFNIKLPEVVQDIIDSAAQGWSGLVSKVKDAWKDIAGKSKNKNLYALTKELLDAKMPKEIELAFTPPGGNLHYYNIEQDLYYDNNKMYNAEGEFEAARGKYTKRRFASKVTANDLKGISSNNMSETTDLLGANDGRHPEYVEYKKLGETYDSVREATNVMDNGSVRGQGYGRILTAEAALARQNLVLDTVAQHPDWAAVEASAEWQRVKDAPAVFEYRTNPELGSTIDPSSKQPVFKTAKQAIAARNEWKATIREKKSIIDEFLKTHEDIDLSRLLKSPEWRDAGGKLQVGKATMMKEDLGPAMMRAEPGQVNDANFVTKLERLKGLYKSAKAESAKARRSKTNVSAAFQATKQAKERVSAHLASASDISQFERGKQALEDFVEFRKESYSRSALRDARKVEVKSKALADAANRPIGKLGPNGRPVSEPAAGGIQDGNAYVIGDELVQIPEKEYEQKIYLPKAVYKEVEDLFAHDLPQHLNPFVKKLILGYDAVQRMFKTNLMAPFSGFFGRNAQTNIITNLLVHGLKLIENGDEWVKMAHYAMAKDSDFLNSLKTLEMPTVADRLSKKEIVSRLGEEVITGAGGRTITRAKLYEELKMRGVLSTGPSMENLTDRTIGESMSRLIASRATEPGVIDMVAKMVAKRAAATASGAAAGEAVGSTIGASLQDGPSDDWTSPQNIGSALGMIAGGFLGARAISGNPLKQTTIINKAASTIQSGYQPFMRVGEMATEMPFRMAMAINEFKKTGSISEAADKVFQHMNDWTALSVPERRYLRRIVPFYSWTKLAVKQTMHQLATNPERIRMLKSFFDLASSEQHDVDPEDTPDWLIEKLKLIGNKNADGSHDMMVSPGSTIEDFSSLMSGVLPGGIPMGQAVGSRLGFGLQSAAEVATNTDFYSGGPLFQDVEKGIYSKSVRASQWKDAPIWLKTLVGYKPATADESETVDDRLAYVMGEVPFSRFISVTRQISSSQDASKLNYRMLARTLLGTSVYRYDPRTNKYYAEKARLDKMEQILSNIGRFKPSIGWHDVNKHDKSR